jgi:hypothetical protein
VASFIELPGGVKGLPGPGFVSAERFDASPVGPYMALSIGRPARLGLRPGMALSTMIVDVHERLTAGRHNWGFPGELGTLTWGHVADETALVWHERSIEVRAVARGATFPLFAPSRLLQRRADGHVVVPARMRGRARFARVDISVPADDPLAPLAGTHTGVVVAGMAVTLLPARQPAGLMWSARAPAGAAEPAAMSGSVPTLPAC